MLRVEPARDLRVAPERIDGAVVVPAPVDVARAALVAPHVAELRVEHRLAPLPPRPLEVPGRPGEGAVADAPILLLPAPAGEVLVPRVEVALGVAAAAAHRVVFDEARGIQRLRQVIDRA